MNAASTYSWGIFSQFANAFTPCRIASSFSTSTACIFLTPHIFRSWIQLLKMCGVRKMHAVDVLKDEAIRQGVKAFANWLKIPQLYVDAAFIGGVDIMAEMAQ